MDIEIPHEELKKQSQKRYLLGGLGIAILLFAVFAFRVLIRPSVDYSTLQTAQVKKGAIQASLTASGTVVPEFEQVMDSPLQARIDSVYHQAGQMVQAGTPIIKLDLTYTQMELEKLEEGLQKKKNEATLIRLRMEKTLSDLKSKYDIKNLQISSLESALANEKHLVSIGGGREEDVRQAELNLMVAKRELQQLEGKISTANPAAQRILGKDFPNLMGRQLESLTPPFGKELVLLPPDQVVVIQAQGTRFYRCVKSRFVDRGFERQFLIMEELTNEILKTEKQAYDKVIRMMSHEVNNSICAINSILQSFEELHPEDEDFQEAVEIAMNRNHRLVKFMGNFADVVKVPQARLEPANISSLIKNLCRLMEAECRKRKIELELQIEEEGFEVPLDVVQFEQVLVNVLKNAIESIGEGGKILIILNRKELKILDNGKGIPSEVQKRLFSPFYSTKPQGQGIGLMLVREILRHHHFQFSLQTRADHWTEFYIGWKQPESIGVA